MTVVLNLVIGLGMLVVVPVGLRLVDGVPDRLRRLWLVGAVPGAVSLWLPRGGAAALLAAGYGLATVALAATAPARLRRRPAPREVALATALLAPVVAGSSLVAERYGYALLGFEPEILSLTVAHFHFAGFAAALVARLVCAGTGDHPMSRAAALCVPGGIAVVFAGFFVGDAVELGGTAILTAGMWLVAYLTWRELRPATADPTTRLLLGVVAVVPVGSMLLAMSWALGHATGLPHPSLAWLAATHGVANALGFGLCAVLAWQRLLREREPQWMI